MTGRRHRALLIGNSEYPRDPVLLPRLLGPATDVSVLQQALTAPATGLHHPDDVTILTDSTRQEVMDELTGFLTSGRGDEQLLVYFSGHGKLSDTFKLQLCMHDTEWERAAASVVSAADLVDGLESCRAAAKVLILDCCYAGNFTGKGNPDVATAMAGRGHAVLASTQPNVKAHDAPGPGQPSPFTRHLVDALLGAADDHDGFITVGDVYEYVNRQPDLVQAPMRSIEGVGGFALARSARAVPRAHGPAPTVDAAALLGSGTRHVRAGRPADAYRDLSRAADAGAGSWSTLAALGLAELFAADHDNAAAHAQWRRVVAATDHRQWSAEAGYRLAADLLRSGDAIGAERAGRAAASLGHPHWSPMANETVARSMRSRGAADAAVHYYRAAVQSGHPDAAAWGLDLSELLVELGDVAGARALLRRITLNGDPRTASTAARRLYDVLVGAGCQRAADRLSASSSTDG